MKSDTDIAIARHMAAAHDANFPVTPFQRGVLYGMKTTCGLARFQLPQDKNAWTLLLQTICEQFRPKEYWDFRHHIPRLHPTIRKTEMEWRLLGSMADKCKEWFEVPRLHLPILAGIEIACAWILEIPGGKALQMLYDGTETEAAIATQPRYAQFGGGVILPNGN